MGVCGFNKASLPQTTVSKHIASKHIAAHVSADG